MTFYFKQGIRNSLYVRHGLRGPRMSRDLPTYFGPLRRSIGPDMNFEVYFEADIDNRCLDFTYFFNGMSF